MKVISIVAAMAALANQATAHYIWNTLAIDGTSATGLAAGIRPNTNYNSPVTGKIVSPLFCCVSLRESEANPVMQTLPPTICDATSVVLTALVLLLAPSALAADSPCLSTLYVALQF